MENMSRWHMRPARSSALPCPACFPIVCLDAACKMNSGLWTMLDCLTSPNMTLTANSKIQGPNLPTAYLPHHVPATAFHQCIVHQLVTSQWVLFHLLEHAQCLSVAALAAKCCKHKLELLTASRLLAVKHPYEEWILMNIGPNLPTMWPRWCSAEVWLRPPSANHHSDSSPSVLLNNLSTSWSHGNPSWLS